MVVSVTFASLTGLWTYLDTGVGNYNIAFKPVTKMACDVQQKI